MFPSILIVDDEASIVQSLSGLLTDEGFEIITASNGYEALKIIDSETPDLVLLDIWMPELDGISLLVAVSEYDVNVYKSIRNMADVSVVPVAELNTLNVLRPRRLLMTTSALDAFREKVTAGKSAS